MNVATQHCSVAVDRCQAVTRIDRRSRQGFLYIECHIWSQPLPGERESLVKRLGSPLRQTEAMVLQLFNQVQQLLKESAMSTRWPVNPSDNSDPGQKRAAGPVFWGCRK